MLLITTIAVTVLFLFVIVIVLLLFLLLLIFGYFLLLFLLLSLLLHTYGDPLVFFPLIKAVGNFIVTATIATVFIFCTVKLPIIIIALFNSGLPILLNGTAYLFYPFSLCWPFPLLLITLPNGNPFSYCW